MDENEAQENLRPLGNVDLVLTNVAEPLLGAETGDTVLSVHPPEQCEGHHCPFHNPSDHHMKGWSTTVRLDWGVPLVERRCEHGVGHPDPDSVAWIVGVLGEEKGRAFGIHGCDGCCQGDD